jgi:hypothetical protein
MTVRGWIRLKEIRIVVNSKYTATQVAAEGPIALINSQFKLAMLRWENKKIRYDNEIFKANKHALKRVITWDLWNHTKKIKISWEYPFKAKLTKANAYFISTARGLKNYYKESYLTKLVEIIEMDST